MDSEQKFTGKAEIYAKARPNYAKELFDWLFTEGGITAESVVADAGAGTGIFAKALLERGAFVNIVEPNADMRAISEACLTGFTKFRSFNGSAEATTLPDNSADFVTAAQAFHWFDADKFKAECARILRPSGKVILVWNSSDDTAELVQENAAVCRKYCSQFMGFHGGMGDTDDAVSRFFANNFVKKQYDNPLHSTRENFIDRTLSASYALTKSDENYQDFLDELTHLFDKYAQNGTLTIPNETAAYIGAVA